MPLPEGFAKQQLRRKQTEVTHDSEGYAKWVTKQVDFVADVGHDLTPEQVEILNEAGAEWREAPETLRHIGKYICKVDGRRFYTNDPGKTKTSGDEGTGSVAEGDTGRPDVDAVDRPNKPKARNTKKRT